MIRTVLFALGFIAVTVGLIYFQPGGPDRADVSSPDVTRSDAALTDLSPALETPQTSPVPEPAAPEQISLATEPEPEPKPKPKKKKKRKPLVKSISAESYKVRKASPKKEKIVYRERERRGTSADMKVAPTQQVTVAGSSGSAGIAALTQKIDELLKANKEAKNKSARTKAYTAAKKQYRAYRKKMVGAVKSQNKEIKKRELARGNTN